MLHKHTVSFKYASNGILWLLKTQKNYRIHVALSVLAIILGWFLMLSYNEFLIVITYIVFGLAIEAVNSSIEVACDLIDTNPREDIKIVKDVAAGAMLIFAIGAVVISVIIYVPKLLQLLS
jgi:diacylglycerol kinase